MDESPVSGRYLLALTCVALLCLLLIYSQTAAFSWDEGFHLLAAQLIRRGQRPYLDFCFPQTPLNAYWQAGWMRMLGERWRALHAVAAVVTATAAMLAGDFVYRRFPDKQWRIPGAITAALLFGMNIAVVEYATLGQAYALCLVLLVGAYRAAVVAVERKSLAWTGIAGILTGAAAASSLLTAAAAPVLVVWILGRVMRGRRIAGVGAFAAGAAIPFLPVLWLFVHAPRIVWFNLFEYQILFRRTNWEDATPHDIGVLTSWLRSPTALLAGALAVAGLWYAVRHRSPELRLCAWLALAISVELIAAHPTFESYFVLVTPFVAILGAAGLYALALRFPRVPRAAFPASLLLLLAPGLAFSLYRDRGLLTWSLMESVARKVEQVTPPGAGLWADEHVYVITGRPPAEGTAFSYAEVIDLPEDFAATLHIRSVPQLVKEAEAGKFLTVSTCEDEEQIEEMDLRKIFQNEFPVGRCKVFWTPRPYGASRLSDK